MKDKLYISLLKKVLIDYHRIGIDEYSPLYPPKNPNLRFKILRVLDSFFRSRKLAITRIVRSNYEDRVNGNDWPIYADTMVGLKRLDNIEFCINDIIKNGIPGDLIETGVWRGGCTIFMNALLKLNNELHRNVWVADSFEGLPMPNVEKYKEDKGDYLYKMEELSINLDTVKNNFKKYDLLTQNVKFLKGWFKDTLSTDKIKKLSLLRLDGDMYESTMDSLTNLYPKLSIGGYIIIDDWGAVEACKKAVLDYRLEHKIDSEIIEIDHLSVFWKK
ncbi:macrocin O-methyltransferase [Flammeovirga pectinis]|uniref:Macrocin O-methyltransferase n=1 Tax=Flammeovirga pectinis TaxID=2494373 RepID=A0A3Q9FRC4_9BACT|nr:TylF/MycF/NovP-related O-methyltransferase [Flammeovirga pectinis]AZQ64635.1 macrocin O-methyltransferase [Flammeovirga pectinis]